MGALPESDVEELLRAGWLKADDLFWFAGMPSWEPLAAWKRVRADHRNDSATNLGRALGATGVAMAQQAGGFARKLLGLAQEGRGEAAALAHKLLEASLPQIRKVLDRRHAAGALEKARAAIHDEALMRKTFTAAYDCLPRAVCRFVGEEAFVRFCLRHRRLLLDPAEAGPVENEKARQQGGPANIV
jgi:hypothetical protein